MGASILRGSSQDNEASPVRLHGFRDKTLKVASQYVLETRFSPGHVLGRRDSYLHGLPRRMACEAPLPFARGARP